MKHCHNQQSSTTNSTQRTEILHSTDRAIGLQGRKRFKSARVRCSCSEPLVPHPSRHFFTPVEAAELHSHHLAQSDRVHPINYFRSACADEENIARLELNLLVRRASFQILNSDTIPVKGVELDLLFFSLTSSSQDFPCSKGSPAKLSGIYKTLCSGTARPGTLSLVIAFKGQLQSVSASSKSKHSHTIPPRRFGNLINSDTLQPCHYQSNPLHGTAFIPLLDHTLGIPFISLLGRRKRSRVGAVLLDYFRCALEFAPWCIRLELQRIKRDLGYHFQAFCGLETEAIDTDTKTH
ncbi:hypothetical protein HG531_006836 [Fusarium graminearum]|nr:hypothetical protein HG531_006836 [Fusarium graminearum]